MPPSFLKHGLGRKPIRTSSQTSLDSASTIPNASGLTFIDNSQGASAAAVELSSVLDDAIEQLDLQGNIRDSLKRQLDILDDGASKYANSGVSEHVQFPSWNPTNHQVELVALAWRCTSTVYSTSRPTYMVHGRWILQETHFLSPSMGGTTKAVSMTRVRPGPDGTDGNSCPSPLLVVVAIRGTDTSLAHMVNLNGRPSTFYLRSKIDHRDCDGGGDSHGRQLPFLAHTGFLNGAEALLPLINAQLDRLCHEERDEQQNICNDFHVILTGHSAGGAIASLLYLKLLSEAGKSWPRFTFSCITFGSPPVVSGPQPPPSPSPQAGLSLAIINEYDLVTRADAPYIRCLAQLFRLIHHLPPLVEEPGAAQDNNDNYSQSHHIQRQAKATRHGSGDEVPHPKPHLEPNSFGKNEWPLPLPQYHHIGTLVLLQKTLQDDEVALKALEIHPHDLARMLFCRLQVHRRKEYGARVELLTSGCFNQPSQTKTLD